MEIEFARLSAALLGVSGLLISVYFALVDRGLISPDSRLLPKVCRMEKSGCMSILASREARLLGIQNFYPGILYYGVVLFWAFGGDMAGWAFSVLSLAAGLSVLAGLYLAFSLLVKLKVRCVLCFTSHAINFLLFLIVALGL